MGSNWLKNMAGIHLSEEELHDIPHPKLELTIHVTTKCVQAFGALGTLVLGPGICLLKSSSRNMKDIVKMSTKLGKFGSILGLFIGPSMTYGKMKSIDANYDAFSDRCYRLRFNHNQLKVDRSSYLSLVSGAVIFPLILGRCPIYGGLFGMSVGVVGAGFHNNIRSGEVKVN